MCPNDEKCLAGVGSFRVQERQGTVYQFPVRSQHRYIYPKVLHSVHSSLSHIWLVPNTIELRG